VRELAIWVIGFLWLAVVLSGFWFWERYDATPGTEGPGVSVGSTSAGRWQLVVFAHPHCPCTRATLHELAELVGAVPQLSVRVVFVCPAGAPAGWERGAAWESAARVSGAEVGSDSTGAEAQRFGAETSGQAVLVDPSGRVRFRGGLTRARGRTGESAGRRAVLAWVSAGEGAPTAPVYGCPLLSPVEWQ
jgi:hypothetical protein